MIKFIYRINLSTIELDGVGLNMAFSKSLLLRKLSKAELSLFECGACCPLGKKTALKRLTRWDVEEIRDTSTSK